MEQTTTDPIYDDSLDMAEFFSLYLDTDDENTCDKDKTTEETIIIETNNQSSPEIELDEPPQEEQITALVVRKEHSILNTNIVYTLEKGVQISMKSFFISLALTFLNYFI